jgi:O-methyltransferase involved in polyketide biosynthesis
VTDKIHVDLSGAPQTMLATLHAKALDADRPDSVLHDTWAREIVGRLDYDWSRTSMTPRNAPSVSMRSAHFDRWTRQFLAVHPRATVVHLGCGLDSRYLRLDPGPDVEWYDVDYPDVAELRRKLLPSREHNHVVAASVTETGYLKDVPDDRPTLALGEGLTMYLTCNDGIALLRSISWSFSGR